MQRVRYKVRAKRLAYLAQTLAEKISIFDYVLWRSKNRKRKYRQNFHNAVKDPKLRT